MSNFFWYKMVEISMRNLLMLNFFLLLQVFFKLFTGKKKRVSVLFYLTDNKNHDL